MRRGEGERFLWFSGAVILFAVLALLGYALLGSHGSSHTSKSTTPLRAAITIVASDRDGSTQTTHLHCTGPHSTAGGYTLREPDELCEILQGLAPELRDRVCGSGSAAGPETATISGRIDSKAVKIKLNRDGNCEALFEQLLPLLPLALAPETSPSNHEPLKGYKTTVGSLSAEVHGSQLTLTAPAALASSLQGQSLKLVCTVGGHETSQNLPWPTDADSVIANVTPAFSSCQLLHGEEVIFTLTS